jgi:hypothetical protein
MGDVEGLREPRTLLVGVSKFSFDCAGGLGFEALFSSEDGETEASRPGCFAAGLRLVGVEAPVAVAHGSLRAIMIYSSFRTCF